MTGDDKLFSQDSTAENDRLTRALQAAGVGTWELDPINQAVWLDEPCTALFGLARKGQATYDEVLAHVHPDDRERINQAVAWALNPQSGGKYDIEHRIIDANDNQLRWLHAKGKAYFNEQGEAYRLSGIVQDSTQQVQSRQQQQQLTLLVENAPEYMAISDLSGKVQFINPYGLDLLGVSLEEATQLKSIDFYSPEELDRFEREIRPSIETDSGQWTGEVLLMHLKNQERIPVFAQVFGLNDPITGKPYARAAICRDLRPERLDRQKIESSEQQFRQIIEQAPMAIGLLKGRDMVIESANEAILDLWGKESNVIGMPVMKALPEVEGRGLRELLEGVYDSGEPYYGYNVLIPLEHQGHIKEGYFDFVYTPIRDADRQISGVIVVATEVTEQAKTRQALEKSEQRFRSLIQEAPVAIALFVGRDMIIEYPNERMLKVWGKGDTVTGKPLLTALPELEGQPFPKILDDVFTTGIAYHESAAKAYMTVDGQLGAYYFNYTYEPIRDENGQIYAVLDVAVDVTEQVLASQQIEAAQADLFQTNQRLNLALDAGRLGSYDLDVATGLMDCTDQCKVNYGRAIDTPFNYDDLMHVIVPDDRERVQQAVTQAIETHSTYYCEYRINWPDNTLHWVKASGQVTYSDDDKPARIIGVTQDITAQYMAQQELEQQVQQRTRSLEDANTDLRRSNENLEQFAYIASHDLQEPLRKIQQFGDLLKTRYSASLGEELDYLERMQSAASRMSLLIRDLLAFSRISTRQATVVPTPLTRVVTDAMENLSVVIDETNAQIQVDPLPTVQGDASQLEQLFQNLLSNAIKFSRTDASGIRIVPQITVSADKLRAADLPSSVKPTRQAEFYYQIKVTDNGIGFDEKYTDRIFQVFQRLHGKNEFAGTGIGLAICQKVVSNHGGAIRASSKPGEGATFYVYLPIG